MRGIIAAGAYIPYNRLQRSKIGAALGSGEALLGLLEGPVSRCGELYDSLAGQSEDRIPLNPEALESHLRNAGFDDSVSARLRIEGWRGEVFMFLETAPGNAISRLHPHDPSWQNWPVLEHAVLGNIVPDFPLINKSFNLSYSGQDL